MSTTVWVTILGNYYLNDTPLSAPDSKLQVPSAGLIAGLVAATATPIATGNAAAAQQVAILGNDPNSYCGNSKYGC